MIADVAIVGAGPAGLSLAIGLASTGARVEIIDEQPAPGGQVYRASERNAAAPDLLGWLGLDYAKGADLVAEARGKEGIQWHSATAVWDIRPEGDRCELALRSDGGVSVVSARHVVLATGAMERPTPFPGWTLPGVMGIGAAQTLFKDAGLLPEDGVVLAGQGPLLYLFTAQILAAGVKPRAVLDFAPRGASLTNLHALGRAALAAPGSLLKGLKLRRAIADAGVEHVYNVEHIEAHGTGATERVSYRRKGIRRDIETSLLLVHDGIIPNTHMSVAASCAHDWSEEQAAWQPRRDATGRTTIESVWVLGDGARILGADAATFQGRIMACDMARALNRPPPVDVLGEQADRRALRKLETLRRFLDHQYAPAAALSAPGDDVTICRCEAVTAGEIRRLARSGCMGPNQLRAFCRAGMGPCMGRQCGNAISRIMAAETGQSVAETGHFSIRPPLKPVTLAQLASLEQDDT